MTAHSRQSALADASSSLLSRYAMLLGVAGAVLALDQGSKLLATSALAGGHVVRLLGGLILLDYTRNSGAAFGILQAGSFVFAIIAAAVSAAIVLYFRRLAGRPLLLRVALAFILGGALGNLIDRVRLGYVVDFIDLRWWPVFNLADSAVVLGVLMLLALSAAAEGRRG